jgi:hypothetical protein
VRQRVDHLAQSDHLFYRPDGQALGNDAQGQPLLLLRIVETKERTGVPGRKYSSSDPALDACRQPQEAKCVCHLRS